MSSTSEVGHNKNVANFSAVVQILIEMGLIYQPTNTTIQLVQLTPIQGTLATSITNLNENLSLNSISIADRETKFKILDKTATQIDNLFKSLNVDDKDKEIVNSLVKNIRGDNKKKKQETTDPNKTTHSTSRQSYDSRLANLNLLIAQLSQFPEYAPNEANISIVTLQAYADELATLTTSLNQSAAALITARKDRNDLLYFDQPSVIKRVKDIKAYLKSLGETGKPYYDAVVRLKFTDYKP